MAVRVNFRILVLALGSSVIAGAFVVPFAVGQGVRSRTKVAARQESQTTQAEPGSVDLARSRVYVYVDKTGLGHEHGVEGKIKSGAIRLGARADAGSIDFDMTSFAA